MLTMLDDDSIKPASTARPAKPFILPNLPGAVTLTTSRLRLRPWRDADLEPFFRLSNDPRVTEHLPACLNREECERFYRQRVVEHFGRHGFGFWAVDVIDVADFIGFVGLAVPGYETHFTPCVEIGWRLMAEHWGRGYATEAAQACLHFAFNTLQVDEVVSFTVPDNARSRRVMERLGMRRDPADDFEHPSLPAGHPLRLHVLYRIARATFGAT